MPSQYPSEPVESREEGGGKKKAMVSVAHSPHVVRGKDPSASATASAAETRPRVAGKTLHNGSLPHLVLVKAKPPPPSHAQAAPPAPRNSHPDNNIATAAPLPDTPEVVRNSIRTQAQPTGSGEVASCSESTREGEATLCPQSALTYTSSILTSRVEKALLRQRSLDDRLAQLHGRVRGRQGRGVIRHVQSQLSYACTQRERDEEEEERRKREKARRSSSSVIPMQVDGAIEDVLPTTPGVARSLKFGPPGEKLEPSSGKSSSIEREMIDVVNNAALNASNESSRIDLSRDDPVASTAPRVDSRLRNLSAGGVGRLERRLSMQDRCSEVVERWRQQLRVVSGGTGGGGGGDITENSSDDEEEIVDFTGPRQKRLQNICRRWEHARAPIGSQWAWLRHRIARINRQLVQLDSAAQSRPKPEQFLLSPVPTSPSLSAATTTRSITSSTNPATTLWGHMTERSKVTNGTNHTPSSIPHLLIPDGVLNGPIQVKDLLSPTTSPFSNMSFIIDDTSSFTSARTRPLMKKPRRTVVKLRQRKGKRFAPSPTPRPVLPRDTPSWVWLDEGLRHVLRDHPYASLPQPKRRQRPTTNSQRSSRVQTLSPSPGIADTSEYECISKPGQKRTCNDHSVPSPTLSRSSTPVPLPPSFASCTPSSSSLPSSSSYSSTSLQRKKRLLSHTPSYDIDNIVIPYSVAASTRLEKLEYKEVLTPGWREAEATPPNNTPKDTQTKNSEELSDEAFCTRHEKFETVEKKRFMNFITGSHRKRTRPSSLSSTPESTHGASPWPLGKARRATFPISPSDPPAHHVTVLCWPPRSFPLQGSDVDALTTPPPPPPLPLPLPIPHHPSPSPSPLLSHPLTPSLPATPTTASVAATPTSSSSPVTPIIGGEYPISPSEWAINPQLVPTTATRVSATPGSIVLRLTKKT